MKLNHRKFLILGVLSVLILIGITMTLRYRKSSEKAEQIWLNYIVKLQQSDYKGMYEFLSDSAAAAITEEDFIARNKQIYERMKARNIHVDINGIATCETGKRISYTQSMDTIAGNFQESNQVTMVKKDDTYYVDWSNSLIFSQLQDDEYIAISQDFAKRGDILDRSNTLLATDGKVLQIGIVPGNIKDKEITISALSQASGLTKEAIENTLRAPWVKDDVFVPLKLIPDNDTIRAPYEAIQGVQINSTTSRIYPFGKAAAHVTGYIADITAEELATYSDDGYHRNSKIGKTGLESIYEHELHGSDGYSIEIKDNANSVQTTLLTKEKKDGQNIQTTIDANMQTLIYEQMKLDAGAAVALHPKTGETLALISTPAYDPNDFVLGMDPITWYDISNDANQPLRNRFIASYVPGSTFKSITGAIGLQNGTITNDTEYQKAVNWKWQKDRSWGNYTIPTTHEYKEPSNLCNALIYSDNIYFAQLADSIGSTTFSSYLKQLGFNETLDYPFSITPSTYGEEHELDNAITLAVSGFGQGKIQVSPIHLTALYTMFVNDGNMVQPYLLYEEGAPRIWKQNVISSDTAAIIYEDLIKTYDIFNNNPSHAGAKTGTAQVGNTEIGWICGIRNDLALTIMIDDTSTRGGSAYNVPLLQNLFKQIP